ncbi:hypothetical protein CC79DRAFT_1372495 [Sarocladium strictum]
MRPAILLLSACLGLSTAAPSHDLTERSIEDRAIKKRACFKSGATWGDKRQLADIAAQSACGNYFVVTYKRGLHTRLQKYLGWDECYNGLKSEIHSCNYGGQATYGNWYYRADPKKGAC